MLPQKIYVNERNQATILCGKCGAEKTADVTSYANHNGPIKARCGCGYVFAFTLEKRKQYRKSVNLPGEYRRMDSASETGAIVIEDLSRTGLAFRTRFKTTIRVDEIIKIRFALDDPQRSGITKNVVVRRVSDCSIGAEFCDNQIDKNLAFYLMP